MYGIVANHQGDSVVAPGALCWVRCVYGGSTRVGFAARAKGGEEVWRDVESWKLVNDRAKFVPGEPAVSVQLPDVSGSLRWPTYAEADAAAQILTAVARKKRMRRNKSRFARHVGLMDEHGRRTSP
jgi:hypothetical protein